ncbi:hypothetical protein LTR85_009918 [Meristemomyces frigidus]|nr:hypothetical protein LTR85_009918 [Meristemomyces frigidus]
MAREFYLGFIYLGFMSGMPEMDVLIMAPQPVYVPLLWVLGTAKSDLDHSREILCNQRTQKQRQPKEFQLLHRLPTEIRLMILELVIHDATPSVSGILARVNKRPADLSFLHWDKQLAREAMSVLYGMKHFWLTSREAVELSKRPVVIDRLRWLTIYERDSAESIFFDVCCDACDRTLRQGMLARLLDGNLLQQITIRLESFYGRRIPADAYGRQGVQYLLHSLDIQSFCRWKCTAIGAYELKPLRHPCGDPLARCTCSLTARSLLRGALFSKVKFEHALLKSLWADALLASPSLLEARSDAHERKVYHWQNRWAWRRQGEPFPHRCERAYAAGVLYVHWIRRNVMLVQQGMGKPKFFLKYVNVDHTLAGVDVMPGCEERLLGYWTCRMATDIAKKILDDPMF